jgi:plastocyanin
VALLALLGTVALLTAAAPASAKEHTYTLRFGPLKLNGYQVRQNTDYVKTPGVNGYITKMVATVVDKKGRPIPIQRVMLHHVLFVNRGRNDHGDRHDGSCPKLPRERFYGTGEEHQTLDLPPGYGVPLRKKDRWTAAWMLMNHRKQRDVGYIQYKVTVETAKKLTPVKAYWLDVTNCGGGVYYNVPGGGAPGTTNHKTLTWRPPFNGRLVAGGAHLHGGAESMKLFQERCGGRQLLESRPLYGMEDDPVYKVLPVLHEPGPINTSWFQTAKGIPVRKGEKIRVSGDYDDERLHVKVMAVMHVYMARDRHVAKKCVDLPSDFTNENIPVPGRDKAPTVEVPLTGIGPDGKATTIDRPPGPIKRFNGSAKVTVSDFSYSLKNLSIPLGSSITWRFPDTISHDVTLANGPFGFASGFNRNGRSYTQKFTQPGKYRLFCSLHPVVMHEVVDVREGASGARSSAPPQVNEKSPGPVIHW